MKKEDIVNNYDLPQDEWEDRLKNTVVAFSDENEDLKFYLSIEKKRVRVLLGFLVVIITVSLFFLSR